MSFQEKYIDYCNKLNKLRTKQSQLKNELQTSYDYKEDLGNKMQFADKQIKDKQAEYHSLLIEVKTEISKIKIEFDLYVSESNS